MSLKISGGGETPPNPPGCYGPGHTHVQSKFIQFIEMVKWHLGMGRMAWVFSCKFSLYFREHLFIRTPLGGLLVRVDTVEDLFYIWFFILILYFGSFIDFTLSLQF